jgi:hypothetical protein
MRTDPAAPILQHEHRLRSHDLCKHGLDDRAGSLMREILTLTVVVFSIGAAFGGWLKDRQWREKARSGFRMASGGRLFTVRGDDC